MKQRSHPPLHPYTPLITILLGILIGMSSENRAGWAAPVSWDHLADGLAITLWTPPPPCRGVPPLLAVEIDPARYRFSVHYYRNDRFDEPPDIHEWQVRTGHDLVFNAGLFRENFAYLGLLYGKGKSLGGKRHALWMGLFVAEPVEPGRTAAGILDLAADSFDERHPPYEEAAQSLMLLDRTGIVRVKHTGKQSQQTIVAERSDGRILILKTTEAASLHAIGTCLRDAYPDIRQAMAMDGGSSSDLSVSPALRQAVERARGGSSWMPLLNAESPGHIGLPAVIGISPRRNVPGNSTR
jgi:uncharacterized protein YigE (DUF2233 family)